MTDEPTSPPTVAQILEGCLGCKWTLHVLGQIRLGVHRPGRLEQTADGLTGKVLNERLAKLRRFGMISRTDFGETPPRVEYRLTDFGEKVAGLLDQIEELEGGRAL
ncbi:MAG: helix-turn-helix domain-containing protein [Planctomycetota bacterium]